MIGFDKLNEMQKKAVLQTEGPVLILAGAGSGKTGALTVRIAHLLETGVKPWNILAITFTNKAAKEMRERVEKLVGDTARDMWISTFHSTCVRILRREIQHLDYENQFSIYDSDDQEKIMREAFKRLNMSTTDKSFSVKGAMSIISHLKEEMTSWEDYAQHVDKNDLKAVRIAKVYQTYQKMLKENNALDFDDLIYKTVLLFRQFPDVLEKYQERFRYIMVDEYQDTNSSQYELVAMLAAKYKNLCVVGDDDQSIYGFRGSKPDIMLNFGNDYRNAGKVVLDVNYRSTPEIVKAAGDVIRFNNKRYKKNIRTDKQGGGAVIVRQTKDFIDEYAEVCERIKALVHGEKKSYSDIAVLYRTSAGIGSLVRRLMENGIPFQIRDKLPDMFEHWIAKDIFAYIRLALGTANRADFISVCNKPKRYIGRDYLTDEEIDLDKLCSYYEDKQWMVERIMKLKDDLAMVAKLNPYAAVNYIRRGIGYDEYIADYALNHHIQPDELFDVLNDIHESAREHNTFVEWDRAVSEYRQRVHEVPDKSVPRVTLTTMHSSKGLEFDTVFIIDANEGVCPHRKAVLDSDIEEERRMFYVAMTRAKSRLYIYSASEKYNKNLEVSRFLIEAGLYTAQKPKDNEKAPAGGGFNRGTSGYRWNRSGTNYSG